MSTDDTQKQQYVQELERMYTEALYGAQSHFEANKRLGKYLRLLILVPSVLAAVAGFLVATGLPAWIGAFSAVGGVMSATASYLGVDRKPASHLRTAQHFTQLRHEIRRHINLADEDNVPELREAVETFGRRYADTVSAAEPTANRDYDLADERIRAGTFGYESSGSLKSSSNK